MFGKARRHPDRHFATQAVHAGEPKHKPYGALTMPIVQTSTYSFEDTAALVAHMQRKEQGLEPVARRVWPLWQPQRQRSSSQAGRAGGRRGRLRLLQRHGRRRCCSLLAFLQAGDHYILTDDCYRKHAPVRPGVHAALWHHLHARAHRRLCRRWRMPSAPTRA